MSRIASAVPVLPAQDLDATLEFYRRVLRFKAEFRQPTYAAVSRDGVQIHFWLCPDRAMAEASGCRLNVVGINALYAECRSHGVIHPNGELAVRPWGLREFAIVDCNGNLICFAEHA